MKEKLLEPNSASLTSKDKTLLGNGLIFAAATWLLSRMVILAAMLLIAPILPAPSGGVAPTFGWGVFSWWDSLAYQQIATYGYQPDNNGNVYSVAFFPLFPLFIRAVMSLGLPFEVAGTLVNNLAFLGAILVLYSWVEERLGTNAARWATAVLAFCPLSLFGTVIYTEGLFLLFSTAALRAFDKQQYIWVGLWGAFATAARPTGIALVPALAIASWRERRPPIAYVASLATCGGLILYCLYCQLQFGDFLAFAHAQQGWKRSLGVDWLGWWKMFAQISVGSTNWKYGYIKDPLHPILFLIICGCGYWLWRNRKKLGSVKVGYGFCALWLILWLLAGDPLLNTVTILGGLYLLWHLRANLSPAAVTFGFCGLGLLLTSGSTISLNRLAYGIVSLSVALGVLLERYPRWGYAVMGFFTLLLAIFAIRFAQHQWVA